jgi:hypothetical protein
LPIFLALVAVGAGAEKNNFLACIASKKQSRHRKVFNYMVFKRNSILVIAILFLLSSCSTEKTPSTTNISPSGESVSAVQSTPTAAMAAPTQTPEPAPTQSTLPTAPATPEPTQAQQLQPTATPIPVTPACTNRATLVKHLSFSDNSSINSNSHFNKAWRIQNTGTCTWTTAYAFVFASGDQLSGPAESALPHDVLPGETIDIQISMKTPDVVNAYTGNWMLRDPNGALFGTGEAADQPIAINILVKKSSEKDKFPAPECG